jgi:hypothetical protein
MAGLDFRVKYCTLHGWEDTPKLTVFWQQMLMCKTWRILGIVATWTHFAALQAVCISQPNQRLYGVARGCPHIVTAGLLRANATVLLIAGIRARWISFATFRQTLQLPSSRHVSLWGAFKSVIIYPAADDVWKVKPWLHEQKGGAQYLRGRPHGWEKEVILWHDAWKAK